MEEKKEATVKDQVVDAVFWVCKKFPGWRVPKAWLEEMYDSVEGIQDVEDFDTQIDELGKKVVHMYLARMVKFYNGIRLDVGMFYGGADDYIRLVSWSRSSMRGVLIDVRGDLIT